MRAPITAILIIFEITQSYEIILPLMICTIISNVISNILYKESIISYPLTKEGIKIKKSYEESILENIKVKDVMLKKGILTFKKNTPIQEIVDIANKLSSINIEQSDDKKLSGSLFFNFPIIDDENNLVGVLVLDDIKAVIFKKNLDTCLVASDICNKRDFAYVFPDDTLSVAMAKMGLRDLGAIPVVEKINNKLKLVGLLRRGDIILAYNRSYNNINQKY